MFKVGVLVVHLRQFGKFFMLFFVGLRSVGGPQFASGWLVFFFFFFVLVCFLFIASGWFARCQWVANADFFGSISSASGWLARGQWVAYADFFSFICQWVAHAILSALLSVLFLMSVGGLRVVTGWLLLF